MPPHTVHLPSFPARYTGSAPPSVCTLWPNAGGHAALEPVYLAALTGAFTRFLAHLPPPPPSQAVAPRPRAAGVPAFQAADGRPSELWPSAAAAPPPTQRVTTPAGGRGGWVAAAGRRPRATDADRITTTRPRNG